MHMLWFDRQQRKKSFKQISHGFRLSMYVLKKNPYSNYHIAKCTIIVKGFFEFREKGSKYSESAELKKFLEPSTIIINCRCKDVLNFQAFVKSIWVLLQKILRFWTLNRCEIRFLLQLTSEDRVKLNFYQKKCHRPTF